MSTISPMPSSVGTEFLGLSIGQAEKPTVEEAARQIEGLFVSMLVKTMRETMAGEMFAGDGSDVWGSMFDQSMGEEIARAGGLGLVEQLQPQRISIAA